jgi:predicted nucleic acid-binding protein
MRVMFDSSVIVAALVVTHQTHTACVLRLNQALEQNTQGRSCCEPCTSPSISNFHPFS